MVQGSEATAATNWDHWPAEVKDHVYLDPKVCNIMAFMGFRAINVHTLGGLGKPGAPAT